MKTTPAGASYECPLVLDETTNSPFRSSSSKRKRQSVICIDDDSDEEDRKMAAQPSPRRPRRAMKSTNAFPQVRPRQRLAFASLDSSDTEEDGDDDQDAALARQLQQQEWGHRRRRHNRGDGNANHDATLEALLKAEQEGEDDDLNQLAMQADASLAARLQKEEQVEKERRKKEEETRMAKSLDGRAWLFVNQVLELHKNLSPSAPGPTTVSVDDMVFLGKNFLQCVQDFESNGWPARVTLNYHYTSSAAMDKIKQDGLMTHAERRQTYSSTNSHGAVFGDGIYTANNPFAFRHFGDTGLLVAVVLGNAARVSTGAAYRGDPKAGLTGIVNTVIGNKGLSNLNGNISEASQYTDEYVLQESKQCLPLMKFITSSVSTQAGKDAVWAFHQELQKLLDQQFNKSVRTEFKRVHESANDPYAVVRGGSRARRIPSKSVSRAASLAAINAAVVPPAAAFNPQAGPASLQARVFAGLPGFPAAGTQAGLPANVFAGLPGFPPQAQVGGPLSTFTTGSTAQFGGPPTVPAAPTSFTTPRTTPARRTPSSGSSRGGSKSEVISYSAPQTLMTSTPADVFVSCKGSDDDCVICMEAFSGPSCGRVVKLKECGHEFHKRCIKDALKAKPCCPVCRVMLQKPQGMCPSGTMSIRTSSVRCGGFESCRRSIVITYTIPNGLQHSFHENPGQPYQGATRIAYLPDNEDGQKLLKRLKFAWTSGLIFTVGTSLTTRQPNCTTWASIHHKTSPSGGVHGFPDPGFFVNCNAELDAAGIPKEL